VNKKVIVGLCIVFICLVVGCASSSRPAYVPLFTPQTYAVQPGDPVNLFTRGADGANGVVASAKPETSEVGINILRQGGNAVDAAVAVGFALSVIEPNASGLGGAGFMIIKLVDMPEAVVIDFREAAPGGATPQMFLGPDGNVVPQSHVIGGLAVALPGEVAGLLYALDNYGSGRFTRAQLMQPAIDFAENGYRVTENLEQVLGDSLSLLNRFPASAELFTNDGLPYVLGDTLRNPDLGRTLRTIARDGPNAFYRGPMAEQIAQAVQDAGGIMTAQDLANYQIRIRKPVVGTYRGYTIISTPPASSGGAHIIQTLNMLENLDPSQLKFGTPEALHAWTQAFRLAFADRNNFMADTDFVSVPLEGIMSKDYARTLFRKFNPNTAMNSATPDDPSRFESGSTTSYSIMDRAGNMVTVTKTINYWFGSGVTVPGTGILMNNGMDDFRSTPGHVQSVEPFKRPLSSMTPTIVLDPQGRPFMTIGNPGALRIWPTITQIISHVIDNGMSIQDAIMQPRIFANATGQVHVENRMPAESIEALRALGYDVNVRGSWEPFFGAAHAVLYDQRGRRLYGGADPRRDGQAAAF